MFISGICTYKIDGKIKWNFVDFFLYTNLIFAINISEKLEFNRYSVLFDLILPTVRQVGVGSKKKERGIFVGMLGDISTYVDIHISM